MYVSPDVCWLHIDADFILGMHIHGNMIVFLEKLRVFHYKHCLSAQFAMLLLLYAFMPTHMYHAMCYLYPVVYSQYATLHSCSYAFPLLFSANSRDYAVPSSCWPELNVVHESEQFAVTFPDLSLPSFLLSSTQVFFFLYPFSPDILTAPFVP